MSCTENMLRRLASLSNKIHLICIELGEYGTMIYKKGTNTSLEPNNVCINYNDKEEPVESLAQYHKKSVPNTSNASPKVSGTNDGDLKPPYSFSPRTVEFIGCFRLPPRPNHPRSPSSRSISFMRSISPKDPEDTAEPEPVDAI